MFVANAIQYHSNYLKRKTPTTKHIPNILDFTTHWELSVSKKELGEEKIT